MANPTLTPPRSVDPPDEPCAGAVLDVICRNAGISSAAIAKAAGKSASTVASWRADSVESINQVTAHRIVAFLNKVDPTPEGKEDYYADLFVSSGPNAADWLIKNRVHHFLKHELAALVA